MKLLIVTATKIENKGILNFKKNIFSAVNIDYLVTGIGSVNTVYNLTKHIFLNKPDFILNVGICGSYNNKMPKKSILSVNTECFADFGIDDKGKFIPLNIFENSKQKLICKNSGIFNFPEVNAITVNTVSGSKQKINFNKKLYKADIETMEGAAVFYTALKSKINFAQIRAVSNFVEPRNKNNWQIDGALKSLSEQIPDIILKIQKSQL